jgi:hypothetical protein
MIGGIMAARCRIAAFRISHRNLQDERAMTNIYRKRLKAEIGKNH